MKSAPSNHAKRMFSSRKLPIHYLVIPKCGCTFVKNLIWYIDNGEAYSNPQRIHDVDHLFARADSLGFDTVSMRDQRYAFTILRNPVDRFLSLYFDKVVGLGYRRFVPLRAVLQKRYSLNVNAKTVDEHMKNCEILIEWLGMNIAEHRDLAPDPHWTPQHYMGNLVIGMDLRILLLNHLVHQIRKFLHPIHPSIDSILAMIERNSSKKLVERRLLLQKPLRRKVNQVYERDREIFEKAKSAWLNNPKMDHDLIPRGSDVFFDVR